MSTEPSARITRVVLKNYKSIVECDVELRPLTILVGPNGSGKSNFLDALRFVSDALNDGLETAVRKRGNLDSLMTRSALDARDGRVKIELHLSLTDDLRGIYSIELYRPTPGGYRIALESCKVLAKRTSEVLSEFHAHPLDLHDPSGPGSMGMLDPGNEHRLPFTLGPLKGRTLLLPHMDQYQNSRLVHRMLRGMAFHNLNVTAIREPHKQDDGERLAADGSNLASTFRRMLGENDYGFIPAQRAIEYLKAIDPAIRDVDVANLDGYELLRFRRQTREEDGLWTFTADEMSDGTLRAFGVLVALFQGRMSGESPVSLVGIEEPEAGLHPAAAGVLLGALQDASTTTQVIVTTHSSDMLFTDDIGVDSLIGVVTEDGVTRIGPIDEVGRSVLRDHLFTAGELLHLDQLRPEIASNGSAEESEKIGPIPGRL